MVPETEVEQAWDQMVDGEELALAERRLTGDRPSEEARPGEEAAKAGRAVGQDDDGQQN